MEKPPPAPKPLLAHTQSLPRRLHGRSKSAGSSLLKPFEFHHHHHHPLVVPTSQPNCAKNDDDDDDDVEEDNEEPETHLREHLQHEMRMREGSTKLLAVAQHPEVILEGSKSILVSEQRMKHFRQELQRRKSGESLKALWSSPPGCCGGLIESDPTSLPPQDQRPCRAVISISEIRIPLMWPEKEHFKNRGFLRRFAVFCLVRVGAQIRDTVLVPCVDRASTDVTFHDALVFKRVSPDFECVVEIYAHNLDDEVVSTPSLIRRKFGHVTASVGRTVGRKMSSDMARDVAGNRFHVNGDNAGIAGVDVSKDGPEFTLVAQTTLRLDDVDEYGKAFDLDILAGESTRDKLPLFGQISCRLAARPSLKVRTVIEGELMVKDVSIGRNDGLRGTTAGEWTWYWCRLSDRRVSCWASREEAESGRPPYMHIAVSASGTQLSLHSTAAGNDAENYPVISLRDGADGVNGVEFLLRARDEETREKWRCSLLQHLLDQSTWGRRICDSSMELHGFDESFISSADLHDYFDSPAASSLSGSPFGTLIRRPRSGSAKSAATAAAASKDAVADQHQLRKSPKLSRANDLYESVAIPTPAPPRPRARLSSSSFSSSSASPRNGPSPSGSSSSPRHRRSPSTCSSSGSSSSKSTPTTPKASSAALTAFPSLDEDELDKLFLKYTSSSGGGSASNGGTGSGFSPNLTHSPSKRYNGLFPSMTLKPNRSTKKLPL